MCDNFLDNRILYDYYNNIQKYWGNFMENQKIRKCFECGSFDAYFTKAYCCYLREDCGYCRLHKKVVDKKSTCEDWRTRCCNPKKRKSAIMTQLKNVLTDISVIKQFIEDE